VTVPTLHAWHELVRTRNAQGLTSLLADDVFFNESFRYVREISGREDAALEFQVEIEGIVVNGIDLIKWNEQGRIVEFKVMIRPLKGINLVHQKMAAMLLGGREPVDDPRST
jgi:hypothetical protein